ncbi:prenyltransferase/squalene oxidase repeat-containing protein [Alkaliphilus transvaalensis]|uniref:hypothetical protein n=1 Tax=Alkaliphilus transvaalensis TaxID=114628 RepID=UPI00047DE712|nr:hypothetical protein [Alkaliphilus transvaalensis]
MKRLKKDVFIQAKESIMEFGRPLEKTLFKHYFEEASGDSIIQDLKKFQNDDGGFGHGLESDFRLPYSSPMATSVGVRHLSEIDDHPEAKVMIKKALGYLEKSFDDKRNGWFAVPKEVNDFPHAPWWQYNHEEGMTVIDRSWGNPSAEIIAYLYKYKEYVEKLDVDDLVEYALKSIEKKESFQSEHEIYCYIKLYETLPDQHRKRLEVKIAEAVDQLIVYDDEKWWDYVPKPLDFVKDSMANPFGVLEEKVNNHLNYTIKELEKEGKVFPPWGEEFYLTDLKIAYHEWIGELTLKALMSLDKFHRLEK